LVRSAMAINRSSPYSSFFVFIASVIPSE
jgi:hypothetical protein